MADDLTALEDWIGGLIGHLSPAARKKLAMAIGRELRRENTRRIAMNVEPDGSAMAPRKPRFDRKTGAVRSRGKMFPKIRLARSLKLRADADGVDIGFSNPQIDRVAQSHHFGDEGYVGRAPDGRTIRTRYEARRLLGISASDRQGIADLVLAALNPDRP